MPKFALKVEQNIIDDDIEIVEIKENIHYKSSNKENIDYGRPTTVLQNSRYSGQSMSPESDIKLERKPINRFSDKDKIDRYSEDQNNIAIMAAMGLPTGFASSNRGISPLSSYKEVDLVTERGTKREKKTYFCQICDIELNSEDTMESHI